MAFVASRGIIYEQACSGHQALHARSGNVFSFLDGTWMFDRLVHSLKLLFVPLLFTSHFQPLLYS